MGGAVIESWLQGGVLPTKMEEQRSWNSQHFAFQAISREVWEVRVGGKRIQSDRIHAEWLVSYISTLN